MARAEAVVEQYLNQQIQKLGGTTRKWVSPGHDGVPDRICIIPVEYAMGVRAHIWFIEVKTLKGKLSTRQRREIDELGRLGCSTSIVYGKEGVDSFITALVGHLNA